MDFMYDMMQNEVLVSALLGWFIAQVLKTIVELCLNRNVSFERLVGSGGMPSSHSATVCALTTSAGMKYGGGSFEFAICFAFAAVVMYDAIGVRQETGKQAKLLNLLMQHPFLKTDDAQFQKRLKELVGHTPLQVVAGAILGIVIAVMLAAVY